MRKIIFIVMLLSFSLARILKAQKDIHANYKLDNNINVIVSRFSRGIPSSSKIEYMDKRTVSLAFSERKPINHSIQT